MSSSPRKFGKFTQSKLQVCSSFLYQHIFIYLRYLNLCWRLQRCVVKNNIQTWKFRTSYRAWISSHLNPFCSTCSKNLYRAFTLSMEHFPVFLIFGDASKNITSNICLRGNMKKRKLFQLVVVPTQETKHWQGKIH